MSAGKPAPKLCGCRRGRRLLSEAAGAQLVEFALVLPFLLVFLVGIIDFGTAWNLKHKLNNAAREGARFGAGESPLDLTQTNPPTVQAVQNVVVHYLINANMTSSTTGVCGMTTSTSPDAGGNLTSGWTYTSPSNCPGTSAKFVLKIERNYTYNDSGGNPVHATRVTLTFPYTWSLNRVMGLLVSGANPTFTPTISSDAIMENQ